MKKRFTIMLCLIITSIAVFSQSALAVRYLETERVDNIVFTDNLAENDVSDFEDFITNLKWYTEPFGNSYALKCEYDAKWNFSILSPKIDMSGLKNYSVSADFTFTQRDERSGLMIRGQDDRNLYNVVLGITKDVPILIFNKRYNCGQWEEDHILQLSPAIAKNKATNLRLDAVGNTITAYVNNEMVFTYTDEENPIGSGKAGLIHVYGETKMQNFRIERINVEEEVQDTGKAYSYKTYPHYETEEISDFSDALFDFYGWDDYNQKIKYHENGSLIITGDNGSNYARNTATYARRKFTHEPIEFEASGVGEGYSVSFKNVYPNCPTGENYDGYVLKVSENKLILEKYLLGKCIVLGERDGSFMSEDWKKFRIEQEDTGNSLKITVLAEDEKVIEAEDKENQMTSAGYISIVSNVKDLKVKASDTKVKSLKQNLGNCSAILADSDSFYINGKVEKTGKNVYMNGSNIMIPLRAFAESFGANVSWNEAEKAVDVSYNDVEYRLLNGAADYFADGERFSLAGRAVITGGTTYVSADFFQKNFNLEFYKCYNNLIIVADKEENTENILNNKEILENVYAQLK